MGSYDELTAFEAQLRAAPEAPWPELAEESVPLFPTELLPEECARLVEGVAASLPVPVDYAACALLGTASAALVGRVMIQPRPGHREPVQLYLCLGGESGTNKSGPMRMLMAPLEGWLVESGREILRRNRDRAAERDVLAGQAKRKNLMEGDRAAIRRRMEEIVDEPEREVVLTDATPESLARRMKRQGGRGILYTDEGAFINVLAGATYGRQGGVANLDTVLKGFDGGRVFVDRVGAEPIDMENAHLSITVGMQPAMIRRMTDSDELCDRGFPQRVLYFLPENLAGVNLLQLPALPQEAIAHWTQLVQRLAAVHRDQPALLTLTRGAQGLYSLHRQAMADRTLTDMGGNAAMRAWARKAHGKTARLAGLLALLEDPDAAVVEECHVRAAVAMMDAYFIPHMKKAFGGTSSLSQDALAMVEVLRGCGEITKGELRHRVGGQKRYKGSEGAVRFDQVLGELQSGGYIRLAAPPPGTPGRRPSPTVKVHPQLLGQRRAELARVEGCL